VTRLRALLALLLALAALGYAPAALAADATPAPAGAGPASKDPARSLDALEDLLRSKPSAAIALGVFRYGLFVAAIVVVVLGVSRRSAVRRGLLPAPPVPPPPVVPLPLPYALVLVVGVYVLVEATGRAVVEVVPAARESATAVGMLSMALPTLAASGLVLWLRRLARERAGRPPPPAGPSVAAGFRTFLVGSAAAVVAALASKLVLDWAGREAVPQTAVLDAVTGPAWQAWLIAAYGALVAPFTEEMLFRGLLHPAVRPFVGGWGATAGVALLFALVHQNAHAFLPLLVLALFLGWLLERTDSVLATFTVHALFNATNLVPILLFRYA
jgi:membrane protease YdiL (CAAX protease family)